MRHGEFDVWHTSRIVRIHLVDMSRRAGVRVVRYTGGHGGKPLRLECAIGPQGERGCQTNGGFVGPHVRALDSRYGANEHEEYAASIWAGTQIMMQSTTATRRTPPTSSST